MVDEAPKVQSQPVNETEKSTQTNTPEYAKFLEGKGFFWRSKMKGWYCKRENTIMKVFVHPEEKKVSVKIDSPRMDRSLNGRYDIDGEVDAEVLSKILEEMETKMLSAEKKAEKRAVRRAATGNDGKRKPTPWNVFLSTVRGKIPFGKEAGDKYAIWEENGKFPDDIKDLEEVFYKNLTALGYIVENGKVVSANGPAVPETVPEKDIKKARLGNCVKCGRLNIRIQGRGMCSKCYGSLRRAELAGEATPPVSEDEAEPSPPPAEAIPPAAVQFVPDTEEVVAMAAPVDNKGGDDVPVEAEKAVEKPLEVVDMVEEKKVEIPEKEPEPEPAKPCSECEKKEPETAPVEQPVATPDSQPAIVEQVVEKAEPAVVVAESPDPVVDIAPIDTEVKAAPEPETPVESKPQFARGDEVVITNIPQEGDKLYDKQLEEVRGMKATIFDDDIAVVRDDEVNDWVYLVRTEDDLVFSAYEKNLGKAMAAPAPGTPAPASIIPEAGAQTQWAADDSKCPTCGMAAGMCQCAAMAAPERLVEDVKQSAEKVEEKAEEAVEKVVKTAKDIVHSSEEMAEAAEEKVEEGMGKKDDWTSIIIALGLMASPAILAWLMSMKPRQQ